MAGYAHSTCLSPRFWFWENVFLKSNKKIVLFLATQSSSLPAPPALPPPPLIAQQCNKERVVEGKGKAICHLTAIGNGSGPRDLWAILFQYGSPEICFLAICIACHKFAFAFAFAVLSTISQPILHNRFVFFSEGHEMFRVLNGKCKARPAEGQ